MEAIPRRKEERIRKSKQLTKHLKFPDEKYNFSKKGHDCTIGHYMKVKLFFSLSI